MINSRDIKELHPTLQRAALELKLRMAELGYIMGISATYRDHAAQNALYAQGRTKPGSIVTNAKGGQSIHNYRLAFDVFKNVKGQEFNDAKFFDTAGRIWMAMGGEWGGSWKGFVDRPHMEYRGGITLAQLQQGKRLPNDAQMPWEKSATPKTQKKEDDEVIDSTKIQIEDKVYDIERIFKGGHNFIKLQSLKAAGFSVDYNATSKMPVIYLPKK